MSADPAAEIQHLLDGLGRGDRSSRLATLAHWWDRSPMLVEPILDRWLADALAATAASGWRPADVERATTAKASASFAALLAIVVAPSRGSLADWRARHRPLAHDAAVEVVAVRTLLRQLPTIPYVTEASGSSGVDDAVLAKVRALLGKAESTTFEAEADALVAKAHELMVRHSIDRAVLDGRPRQGEVLARRVLLDEPYLRAKFTLLSEVASASSCQALLSPSFGFATVFGHVGDLDAVEMLYTSLLLQATAGLVDARPSADWRPAPSQVAAYRRSWLLAYARRIGERLEVASRSTVAEATVTHGDSLLPVLAARDAAVEAALKAAAPNARSLRTRASSGEGWRAGRAAGDRATLGATAPLPSRRRALGR